MSFKEFIKSEGLKKLALMRLKSCSYGIVIYLYNELICGVDEIIASRKELSMMLGCSEREINEGLDELQFCHMIQMNEVAGKTLRIRALLNIESWNNIHLPPSENSKKNSLGDAKNLHSLVPTENDGNHKNIQLIELNIFDDPIPFPKQKNKLTKSSKEKNNTHGKHSKDSNGEHTLNDLNAFREKHHEIDEKIKSLALTELDMIKHEKRTITSDEELLLQILIQHHQPRKQLLMALNSNMAYPNLKFFLATSKLIAEIPDSNKK